MKLRRDDWDDDERQLLSVLGPELERVRARHRDDPAFELLRAAREDALPDPLQAAVAAHLERSEWNRALVDGAAGEEPSLDSDAERQLLARVTRQAASRDTRSRWRMRMWIPAFAVAAVAVVVVTVFRRTSAPSLTLQPQPAAERQAAAPQPSATFALALDRPEVKLTQAALVLRSAGREARFVDDIAPALSAYRANDDAAADRRLAALEPRYPKSVELPFYRAIAQLFLNDAPGALASLRGARRVDDGSFAPEIAWYLAVAYERAGDPVRARAELDALCRQTNAFSPRACQAAPKLGSR